MPGRKSFQTAGISISGIELAEKIKKGHSTCEAGRAMTPGVYAPHSYVQFSEYIVFGEQAGAGAFTAGVFEMISQRRSGVPGFHIGYDGGITFAPGTGGPLEVLDTRSTGTGTAWPVLLQCQAEKRVLRRGRVT